MRPGLRPTGLGSPPVRVRDAGRWRGDGVEAGPIRQRAGGDGGTTAASAQFITNRPEGGHSGPAAARRRITAGGPVPVKGRGAREGGRHGELGEVG